MLAAVKSGQYAEAADEMLASKWAQQVRQRAIELARQMEVG
jgi:lysozyme